MYRYIILCFSLSFLISYEVGHKLSYYDQLKQYPVCYGSDEHDLISDGQLSFSDFNGSSSDFHVFFIDLAASW